mmetsp:Transcript_7040/g.19687  ORF Transcript_7040/g.19687 Transcript_7040/m.19687 type:complete len:96 (-) Transcript_7040:77-364(-)
MQRPCALLCLAAAVGAFQPPAARGQQLTQMYGFDNPASRPKSNKDAYKPALGSRVDDTLSTIPQKGPSLDMGSAKMVGFYGVLAAAVAAALAYQG